MATKGIGRPLTILLQADTSGLGQNLQKAQSSLDKFGNKVEAINRRAVLAFGAITLGAKSVIDSASDLNETIAKTGEIFGEGAKDIEAFAEAASGDLGLSKKQALDAASTFAILGRLGNITGEDLNTFAKDLTSLSTDLASFNNTSTDESITALGAALRGESEPIRRFGILISAASLDAAAFNYEQENGVTLARDAKNQLTEESKVLARYQLILEQTTIQQGDFARTSDGAANQQRILAAEIENSKAAIGVGLLPAYQGLLSALIPLADYTAENADLVRNLGIGVAVTAGSIIVLNYAIKAVQISMTVFSALAAATRIVMLTLAAATGSASAAQTLAELTYKRSTVALVAYKVAMAAQAVILGVVTAAQYAFNLALSLNPIGLVVIAVAALAAAFVLAYKKIEPFRDLMDSIFQKIKDVVKLVGNSPIGKAIGGLFDGFKAAGGPVRQGRSYVVGEAGPELFTANTSGSISPAGSFGGGGGVNITINGAIDPEGVRRSLENLFQNSARRTGAVNFAGATL
jgi:hypothetical protein